MPYLIHIVGSLTGGMYLGFGLWLLVFPRTLEKADILFSSAVGSMEARAFYGGLEIGIGVFILYHIFHGVQHQALFLSFLILLSTVLARVYGAFVDSAWSSYLVYALLIEGSLLAGNTYLLFRGGSVE